MSQSITNSFGCNLMALTMITISVATHNNKPPLSHARHLRISARKATSFASNPIKANTHAKATNTHEAAQPKKRICCAIRLVWPDKESMNAIIGPADCKTAASMHANGIATRNVATRAGRCSATNARIFKSELTASVVATASPHSGHTSKRSRPCKSYLQRSQRTCEASVGMKLKVILILACAVPQI